MYWVDSTIVPFLDVKGKPYQYVSIKLDISDRKKYEKNIIKAKVAADSANQAKSEFIANMSHEIRTPMNAVIGFSELLSKSVMEEKQKSQIESIRSSGRNLLKIINDILDLSKIEAGKIVIKPTSVNLINLLNEIKNMFAPKVNEKGIHFAIEYESRFHETLLIDEVRLRQILFNLIGNAINFTDKGNVILSVYAQKNLQKKENLDLVFKVKDTGIGIPANQKDLIFEAFGQQSGQSSKYGGSGLGLSITKKLINIMGGTISLESKVSKGSTFTVIIPNTPVSDVEIEITKKEFDTSKILFNPAKVLVVDDITKNRKLIIDFLENSSLTFLQAVNGKEAVEKAKKHLPDLILMDLKMPVMDGCKAAKIIKNNKLTKAIPIIVLSASIEASKKKSRINIFDEYLLKPLIIEQFFDKLKKIP